MHLSVSHYFREGFELCAQSVCPPISPCLCFPLSKRIQLGFSCFPGVLGVEEANTARLEGPQILQPRGSASTKTLNFGCVGLYMAKMSLYSMTDASSSTTFHKVDNSPKAKVSHVHGKQEMNLTY